MVNVNVKTTNIHLFLYLGSDLDGDEYTVIWMEELMFPSNAPARSFPKAQEKRHIGPVLVRFHKIYKYIPKDKCLTSLLYSKMPTGISFIFTSIGLIV